MKQVLFLLFILMIATNMAFGAHWHRVPIDINQDFTGLHFFDENRGFLVTKNGQIISLDLSVSPPLTEITSFPTNFYDICFLNNGLVDVAPVLTHKFPLHDFIKAMETTKAPKRDCGKIILLHE